MTTRESIKKPEDINKILNELTVENIHIVSVDNKVTELCIHGTTLKNNKKTYKSLTIKAEYDYPVKYLVCEQVVEPKYKVFYVKHKDLPDLFREFETIEQTTAWIKGYVKVFNIPESDFEITEQESLFPAPNLQGISPKSL